MSMDIWQEFECDGFLTAVIGQPWEVFPASPMLAVRLHESWLRFKKEKLDTYPHRHLIGEYCVLLESRGEPGFMVDDSNIIVGLTWQDD